MLAFGFTAGPVGAEQVGQQLQLEVIVNGSPTKLIGSFIIFENRHIAARRQELEEIGLNPRGYASPDKLIVLDDLPGLSYRYEEAAQRISITAPDKLLAIKKYEASNGPQKATAAQTDYGAVNLLAPRH
jgi:outer membrane usher protein